MLFRDAQWNTDPAVAAGDIEFLIQAGVDFIIGYPDQGTNIADAILEAKDADIPYSTYSAGWVGLPEQEGALIPGEDYLTVVGEDLCALVTALPKSSRGRPVPARSASMGGTPACLSLGLAAVLPRSDRRLDQNIGPADTYWRTTSPQTVNGWLSTDPDSRVRYERRRPQHTALQAYDYLGIPSTISRCSAYRSDPFLHVEEDGHPTSTSGTRRGNFQSRVAVTASMMFPPRSGDPTRDRRAAGDARVTGTLPTRTG